MNVNGDYASKYAGVGQETAPSYTFGNEPITGPYLESPGSSSSYSISKRGTKRFRITDTKTQIIGPLETDGIIPSGSLSLPNGTESAPALAYTLHPGTGLFYDETAPAGFAITTGSTKRLKLNNSGCSIDPPLFELYGSQSAPSYSFQSDSGTGMYRPSHGTVTITSDGTDKLTVGGTGVTAAALSTTSVTSSGQVSGTQGYFTDRILVADGSSSAAAYSFSSQTNMGLARGGTNNLNIYSGGTSPSISTVGIDVIMGRDVDVTGTLTGVNLNATSNLTVGGTGSVTSDFKAGAFLSAGDGSASLPVYSFSGDNDTGIYRIGSGTMGFTTNNSTVLTVSPTSLLSTVDVVYPYYNIIATLATQTVLSSTATGVAFTSKTSGTGIAFSNPTTNFTIPVAGLYSVKFGITFAANSTGIRTIWSRINIATTPIQIATHICNATTSDLTRLTSGYDYQFAANDTVQVSVYQTSGGNLVIANDASNVNFISINRIHS